MRVAESVFYVQVRILIAEFLCEKNTPKNKKWVNKRSPDTGLGLFK